MGDIQFIDEFNQLIGRIIMSLKNSNIEIFILGAFDNVVYVNIFNEILKIANINNCKIILPYIASSGILSRTYINKIGNKGGEIRINSQVRNNIILIGNEVFIPSFSAKYSKQDGVKFKFEHCVQTQEQEIVGKIYKKFINIWKESIPIIN